MNRLHRPAAAVLALAVTAGLTACGSGGDSSTPAQPPAGRIAPAEAKYSLDTTPEYFKNLDEANTEMRKYFGEYLPTGVEQAFETVRNQPVAEWIGGDVGPERIATSIALSKDSIPVYVLYHIPDRDLDSFSAGGAVFADDYLKWVKEVSTAIGTHDTVVVIEPDALPHMREMDEVSADERATLLATALTTFAKNNPNTAVYLDAGNSAWLTPVQTAGLLKQVAAKGAKIPGISLNVSNFQSEEATQAYSEAISKAYGEPLYTLIDSSRNGADAPNRQWCNPVWARTGTPIDNTFDPTERFEQLYIKRPGESDGTCGVSKAPAGTFDQMLLWRLLGEDRLVT